MKRVVITGLGAVTPLGTGVEKFWDNVKKGECGIDFLESFDTEIFKVKIAAEVKDFVAEEHMEKRETRKLDRFTQFAIAASNEAIKDSGINLEEIDKEKMAVILGSGIGGMNTLEKEHKKMVEKNTSKVSPFMIPMMISNLAAGNVAIKLGAKGICNTVVTACASGSNAIGEAFRHIKMGFADIAVTGGTESSVTPLAIAGFTSLTALNSNNDPKKASIPFDKDRSGFVMGEGAGILIIESLEHAQARGAEIYAEIVGYGATCDAYHITSPSPDGEGAARAMKMAMQEAGIEKEEVSYINAHGTSTPYNDKFETLAIKTAFGDHAYKMPVSSTKSMIGHLLGASGAVEAVTCVKSIQDGYVHQNVGLQEIDEELDLDYVKDNGREMEVNYAMSNSLGFGGHNASLLFKKWSE